MIGYMPIFIAAAGIGRLGDLVALRTYTVAVVGRSRAVNGLEGGDPGLTAGIVAAGKYEGKPKRLNRLE